MIDQQKYPETVKTARRELWAAITRGAGSGAGVAIMEKGELVYSDGIGAADRETNRPVDACTRFDVASVSKMFTTAAVMRLVDLELADIDRPVCEYVPEFVMDDPRYRDITIRMLFNHSSGLPGSAYNQSFCFTPNPDYKLRALEAMRRARLKHAPGEKSSYCNDGFTLAELVIERVSGLRYIDFIREQILEPLSLRNTGESVGMSGAPNVGELYDDLTGRKSLREISPGVGMGGLSSTPEDLCRFGQSFCENAAVRVLSSESLREMLTPQPSAFSGKLRTRQEDCHMGWDINVMDKYESRGVRVLIKGGLTWYATKFIVMPELDVSMALSFAGSGPSTKPALAILDAFLEEKGYGSFRAPVKKQPRPQPVPPELRGFAGFYSNGNIAVEISFTDDGISIKPLTTDDQPAVFNYNDGYFYKKDDSVPYYFAMDGCMSFFVAENEHCADLVYQKLEYQNMPKALALDIHNKVWLNMNIDVDQLNWNGMFAVKSRLCPGLPGYVEFAGVKRVESGSYASAAGTYFRDQKDLLINETDGKPTAYLYDYIMRPEEDAASLTEGKTSAQIPETGFGTAWLKTEGDFIINVNTAPGVIVHVIGPDCKKFIFSNRHQESPFFAPKGSYVAMFGKRGGRAEFSAE